MSEAGGEQVDELLKLIRVRVAHRLSDWPREQRRDVEQDAALLLIRAMRRLGPAMRNPAAYTQTLVDRLINTSLRRYSRRKQFVVLATEYDETCNGWIDTIDSNMNEAVDIAATNEIAEAFRLSPKQKRLLSLKTTLGTTEAVAQHLNIPLQTAHERVSRLHRAIRDQISERRAA